MLRKHFYFSILLLVAMCNQVMAYEQAYPKTEVDQIEVKSLPLSRFIETTMDGQYFDESDGLFKRLFKYIKDNEVSMTIPVEGTIDNAMMRFYLGTDASDDLDDTQTVDVVKLPARDVVSIGGRGSYSEANLKQGLLKLEQWLDNQEEWQVDGDAYGVYWNGPFTLWFLKRYEVHIPIKANSKHTTD